MYRFFLTSCTYLPPPPKYGRFTDMKDTEVTPKLNNWQVIGHQQIISTLQKSVVQNKVNHAYLFVGPESVGKKTVALALAKTLQCHNSPRPCYDCKNCRDIAAENHPDVLTLKRLKKKIGINQVREAQHQLSLKSYNTGAYKICLIDGADHLSLEAANALLKILEEPTGKVIFILLASNLRGIIPTVVSRCVLLNFNLVPETEMVKGLPDLANESPAKVDLSELVSLAFGRPGWAIRSLNNSDLLQQRQEKKHAVLEMLDNNLSYFSQSLAGKKFDNQKAGEILNILIECFRDMAVYKLAGGNLTLDKFSHSSEFQQKFERYSVKKISSILEYLFKAKKLLAQNSNPKLIVENLIMILRYE